MIVSLNEVEMTALKAARGAGYPWGLAEEAGKAARFLAERHERNLDWLAPLLALVTDPPGPARCPLVNGGRLSDDPESVLTERKGQLGEIAAPGLLLAALERAARVLDEPLLLTLDGLRFRAGPVGGTHGFELKSWRALCARAPVTITRGEKLPLLKPLAAKTGGVPVAMADWQRLEPYVQRTYVPESETSRLKGAGAGLHDND